VLHGDAREEVPRLAAELKVGVVYANHDYEPYAVARDAAVARALQGQDVVFHTRKDQVIFEKDEVLTRGARPFVVFTPYKNAWLAALKPFFLKAYPIARYRERLASGPAGTIPSLDALGFQRTNLRDLGIGTGMSGARGMFESFKSRLARYHERRDFPAIKGTSFLSVHLRFGTISIRALARAAWSNGTAGADAWLSELIWRDFYFAILHHYPYVAERAFRPEFARLEWPNDERLFAAWCEGRTGYPLVDAAMRQINLTGYMHNRLRMIAASFLTKDLLVDWRWGERYFAERLTDFDLAANNGGWQWAASTGCDAQPYFRIFNPVTQSRKFDPDGKFIRHYVPELAACDDGSIHAPWKMSDAAQRQAGMIIGRDYPAPVIDHTEQRRRVLELYGRAKNS
jgi:deoxyribodipyrimidine photo-lyase